jgi:HK97 family phage major capsid protein
MPETVERKRLAETRSLPIQFRELQVRADGIDAEARTVELAFSSELPYERWWGIEVLDHAPSAMRLGRLNGGGALLVDHDSRDHVGVVERAYVGNDRMGRAVVRFGKSQRASEVFQDVVDGIRSLVSVGYRIHEAVLEKQGDDGDTYRVTDWEPYEISLVSIPADPSVGVGRSTSDEQFDINLIVKKEALKMPEQIIETPPAPDTNTAIKAGVEARVKEIQNISALGAMHNMRDLADQAIKDGLGLVDFQQRLLEELQKKGVAKVAESPDIDLSDKERKQYSFLRLMNYLANPTNERAREAAKFEIECSHAAMQKSPIETDKAGQRGIVHRIPSDVLRSPIADIGGDYVNAVTRAVLARMGAKGWAQRDLTVGTATAGGHTVATDLLASSFIELLVNQMVLMSLGTTMLRDLNGNVAIPRQTGGATAYWLAESGAPTESQQAFDQVTLSPKTVGAFTDYSRQLLMQSSLDVEGFVRMDLARTLALAIDLAGINGSGASNQPRGIINTVGIGSVAGGTNGLAPTWAHVVGLETAVANPNAAIGNLSYLTNTKVRGKLKTTEMFSGTNGLPVWQQGAQPLNGYGAAVSNQVPSTLTKGSSSGVCSAILFGNFADLLIGMWGGLDILVDPYTGGTAGTVRIVGLQSVDVAVRHPESFAAMLDALTT